MPNHSRHLTAIHRFFLFTQSRLMQFWGQGFSRYILIFCSRCLGLQYFLFRPAAGCYNLYRSQAPEKENTKPTHPAALRQKFFDQLCMCQTHSSVSDTFVRAKKNQHKNLILRKAYNKNCNHYRKKQHNNSATRG